MGLRLKEWNQLGIAGPIYEEDEDEDEDEDGYSSSSADQSIPSLESTPSLQFSKSRLLDRNRDTDVVIHVQSSCFRLHKQALISRSDYLKRQLNELSEISLSPQLNITAETFSLVTEFCYGDFLTMTPFNIAALRTAAVLLEMTEIDDYGEENLMQKTETYFCRLISINKESVPIVLSSSFSLLPEAETMAFLLSRCIEALSLTGEADEDLSCLDGVKRLEVENLQLILESTSQRLTECHDLLYTIIDLHLKENGGKLREEHKIRMCNYIDCSILSPKSLMHAVQNPRMPLRFVVQAMFIEQLNTRRSIISSHGRHPTHKPKDPVTLGAILERDAALRHVDQLKSVMSATNTRIQTLENELSGMRRILSESEPVKGRSASFRLFSSEIDGNKVERGQTGSVSLLSVRDVKGNRVRRMGSFSSSEEEFSEGSVEKNLGQRLISGLKSAFRLGLKKKKREIQNRDKLEMDEGDIVIIKKDQAFHRCSRSQS